MEPVAELCMVRVALVREAGPKVRIVNAADATQVARQIIGDADRETFLVLLLDTKLFVTAAHIAAVGELLGISVQDHVIVGYERVYSFRAGGEMAGTGDGTSRRYRTVAQAACSHDR